MGKSENSPLDRTKTIAASDLKVRTEEMNYISRRLSFRSSYILYVYICAANILEFK